MLQQEITVQSESGIHARPASKIMKKAESYKSDIILEHNGKQYIAKSILSVMAMAADKGDKIIVKAEGIDEQKALEGMVNLLLYELE